MPKMPKVMESLRSIFYIKLTALKVHTLTSGTSDALNFYCFMSVVQHKCVLFFTTKITKKNMKKNFRKKSRSNPSSSPKPRRGGFTPPARFCAKIKLRRYSDVA